ncbi:M14 family zinc carboxypeptidase [Paenibacillus sp. S-12]|uniref:M14 family zinc carboxypeptidase n=1 Tax=Paenibacillus sp. S-12 TaxID=3031371 RepID=UPI0025A099DF|nr:M14 family zinc carboxypeptidase [Paenibacillus sp. S-12]
MAVPYVVQKGDTYLRICARHGIQLHALLSANPQLRADGYAVPGQVIDIPDPPINKYVVQAKDRFYHIAQRFQVSTQRLAEANPTLDPRRLIPGQLMLIPFEYSTQWERKTAEYGYAQMMRDIGQLQNSHSFIRVEQIGNSVMGKPIPAIIIGKGTVHVHANGSVHANEWITSALLMQFVEDYARAYDSGEAWNGWDALAAFERTTLWMVPMSNPDGVELVQEGISPEHPLYASIMEWNQGSRKFQRWKANIRGIDLNDQFPAYWEEEQARRGVYAPAPLNYGGTRPLTEPEAIALAELSERIPFEMALSFHTQGQEIYWNYRDYEPDDACSWAERFQRASGYRAVKLSGSDAGYKDWFIQRYRKPGFTIEVGNGVSPLPLDDFDAMYREVAAIMKEALLP